MSSFTLVAARLALIYALNGTRTDRKRRGFSPAFMIAFV